MAKMNKVEKSLPSREITLNIDKNEYVVKFPNVGQLIDIEVKKSFYSQGQHNDLSSSNGTGWIAASMIDMMSTFEVLIPELVKDLTVQKILELDLIQCAELNKAYQKQYLPWFYEWLGIINEPQSEE